MPNTVTVTTEASVMITKAGIRSMTELNHWDMGGRTAGGFLPPSSILFDKRSIAHFTTVGPELMSGSLAIYDMLAQALEWWQRKADARVFFYYPSHIYYRYADAAGAFADLEEAFADARVYFLTPPYERTADAAFGLAAYMYERKADARAYFAFLSDGRTVDVVAPFGIPYDRTADATVFFATTQERTADAVTYFVHLSDLYNLQEFLAMYIPQLWYSPEWGAVAVVINPGESKTVIINKDPNFLKAAILFGIEIKARIMVLAGGMWVHVADINEIQTGWARTELPSQTEKVLIINTGSRRITAFVVFVKLP